jgi:hypothetical protein
MSNISIIGIRHGEAIHNVLYDHIGTDAFTQFQDTTLTSRGLFHHLCVHYKPLVLYFQVLK